MKNRITVRHGLLTDLANWLIENGWTIQEPKGEYEVLRACKQGYVRPLLIYDRDKGCGYSIDERDEKVYRKWQNDRNKRGLLPNTTSTQEETQENYRVINSRTIKIKPINQSFVFEETPKPTAKKSPTKSKIKANSERKNSI